MENDKFFKDLTICKHIFHILENIIKVFMFTIMSIATSQEIISEMKTNINIKDQIWIKSYQKLWKIVEIWT